jgi:hypothetical protein
LDHDTRRNKEMASRFAQRKPDPAIKKNVIRSRQGAQKAKRAQGIVVGISMAATLFGWALFSRQDAQVAATAQLADSSAVAVASAQQTADSTPTPIISTIQTSDVNQGTN